MRSTLANRTREGGNDALRRRAQLNNIDKHRLLVTVIAALRSVDVAGTIKAEMFKLGVQMPHEFTLRLRPADHEERPGLAR